MREAGLAPNSALAFGGDIASKAGALVVLLIAARSFSVDEFAVVATALACAAFWRRSTSERGRCWRETGHGAVRIAVGCFRALRARLPLACRRARRRARSSGSGSVNRRRARGRGLAWRAHSRFPCSGCYRSCQDTRPEALQRLVAAILSVDMVVTVRSTRRPRADARRGFSRLERSSRWCRSCAAPAAIADLGARDSASSTALRRAAPIGLLALATVAYYRSGTIALAVLGSANETAVFTLAASFAFGLLMAPNAITTALLPRLVVGQSIGRFVERSATYARLDPRDLRVARSTPPCWARCWCRSSSAPSTRTRGIRSRCSASGSRSSRPAG